jgi:Na+/H+ antiporter NhaD/arsenite permease-like protein
MSFRKCAQGAPPAERCYEVAAMLAEYAAWTMLPFAALVLAIAVLPQAAPKAFARASVQSLLSAGLATPVVLYAWALEGPSPVVHAALTYGSFIATLGSLYVTAGGIHVSGDLEATPRVNAAFVLVGSLLASVVGTAGASVLLIRPLLRTNSQRTHAGHVVPFFILAVSNAGGLLLPLGDPPLLVGYLSGVPFFWTLHLAPYWLLYAGAIALVLYLVDRRAWAREPESARRQDALEVVPLALEGKRNVVILLAIAVALLLPRGVREAIMLLLAAGSFALTPRAVYVKNDFSFAPIVEIAILFAGIFACLIPVEHTLAGAALSFPLRHAWQLFWASGLLSSVLDNAPTYAAFSALARGLSRGAPELVAGITPAKLAAVSLGSVVMGALTYVGNGPNMMVRAIAVRSGYPMPSFLRYAAFAFTVLLPMSLVTTLALYLAEP